MSTISTHHVNTTVGVTSARHRAGYAWCTDVFVASRSFMPNTKHQRLREPSQE